MSKGYFEWLKTQVDFLDFPEKYDYLFHALHQTEFTWKHPMDKNRAMEGLELRTTYHEMTGGNAIGRGFPATVLEVLVALARRMNYICASFDEDKTKIIFWRLMSNLNFAIMNDQKYLAFGGDARVNDVLTRWMERLYEPDGRGGVFPLQNPRENQREVEIWYQMNQYLNDPNGEDLKGY